VHNAQIEQTGEIVNVDPQLASIPPSLRSLYMLLEDIQPPRKSINNHKFCFANMVFSLDRL